MDTEPQKPIHTLILDTGPLIKNDPPISTLLSRSHTLLTLPSILLEIRDPATRSRVETTLKPFLQLRDPKPESIKVVQDFARRSGDLQVLSRVDVAVLALAYEVECERNGGDWRLRRVPGQKGVNGMPPGRNGEGEGKGREGEGGKEGDVVVQEEAVVEGEVAKEEAGVDGAVAKEEGGIDREITKEELSVDVSEDAAGIDETIAQIDGEKRPKDVSDEDTLSTQLANTDINDETQQRDQAAEQQSPTQPTPSTTISPTSADPDLDSDSDTEGWITPSNLSKHLAASSSTPTSTTSTNPPETLQVATLTSDFAMQNVLLLMNLNLLSPSLSRISTLKTHILRCHACFLQVKDLTKQFCPRCGQPALTRVTCSTDARTGEFKLHLKKNMQWNTRGDRYSIPKPVHGSANGKRDVGGGGGKGGWGQELILSEDQKEYVRKVGEAKRAKARDLMDEDYLPGILTGERHGGGGSGGKVRIGAGRNVNSRKR